MASNTMTVVGEIEFLGLTAFDFGTRFGGTTIGGLSGITYDAASDRYWAISDDRDGGTDGTPRMYKIKIDLADGSLDDGDVSFKKVVDLKLPSGVTFDAVNPDPEGIALTQNGTLLVTSERGYLGTPAIYEFDTSGMLLTSYPVDTKFVPNKSATQGIRDNLAFESMTVTPDGKYFYTATEGTLLQDGANATTTSQGTSRILKYDAVTGLPVAEYVYKVDAIAEVPNPSTGFAVAGVVDMLAVDNAGTVLVMERSFSAGLADGGDTIKIYVAHIDTATDVSGQDALVSGNVVVRKELLLNLDDTNVPYIDNVEGMTFGPTLADGRQSLILVSDDNFSATQETQFYAFALDLETGVTVEPMLEGKNGWTATDLLTVGATLDNGFTPTGVFDGIGAFELDANTVRVFVNSELPNNAGYAYDVNDFTLTGARINYFDIDKATMSITDGGLAYDKMVNALGVAATPADTHENLPGLDRFCSGQLVEAEAFGAGKGLADRVYFAGEETGGTFSGVAGAMWALDIATDTLYAVPAMGRGAWENATEIDTGTTSHVAFLMGDDTAPFDVDGDGVAEAAPMFLYVGEKSTDPNAGFLERNGLKDGEIYVFVPNNKAFSDPSDFGIDDGNMRGKWKALDNTPKPQLASEDGSTGYDEYGYPTQRNLWAQAEAKGAFEVSRPEDSATNPNNGAVAVLASTGRTGAFGNADEVGEVYKIKFDFSKFLSDDRIKGTVSVIYDGDSDPNQTLRSPDNLDWSADGFIYIQEDAAFAGFAAVNPENAGIVRLAQNGSSIERIAEVDQTALSPWGVVDETSVLDGITDVGNWESSGILDVSELFGYAAGSVFLADVQAHSLDDQDRWTTTGPASLLTDGNLVEGGQLVFLTAPGVTIDVQNPVEPDWTMA